MFADVLVKPCMVKTGDTSAVDLVEEYALLLDRLLRSASADLVPNPWKGDPAICIRCQKDETLERQICEEIGRLRWVHGPFYIHLSHSESYRHGIWDAQWGSWWLREAGGSASDRR